MTTEGGSYHPKKAQTALSNELSIGNAEQSLVLHYKKTQVVVEGYLIDPDGK